MLTTYQFASNTPIQAIDLDGLEMLKCTENNVVDTKLKIISNSKLFASLSDKMKENYISEYKIELIKIYKREHSGLNSSGKNWSFEISEIEYIDLPSNVDPKTFVNYNSSGLTIYLADLIVIEGKGGTFKYPGQKSTTGKPVGGYVVAYVGIFKKYLNGTIEQELISAPILADDTSHELGHIAGLPHAWQKEPFNFEMHQSDPYNSPTETPKKEIKNNVMNSSGNTVERFRSSPGDKITPGHRDHMINTIPEE